jgi:hypothetical protein
MKNFIILIVLLFLAGESNAQLNRYIIRFKHKGATTFTLNNPSSYLSQRAIDRRTRYNIAIDSTDLPVPPTYITQIQNIPNVTVHNVSRWLNAITIRTTDPAAITAINALPFVQSTTGIASRSTSNTDNKLKEEISPLQNSATAKMQQEEGFFNYGGGASLREILLHNGNFLHDIGLRGQGMQIAMLDGGFFQYTTLDAFDSANTNNQFLSTWDFVNREASVIEDSQHGMSCLSTIAANIPGLFIGTAPKTSFHLFKTEDNASEYPIEEFNWACGAERADSVGADVISSSVGYGYDFNPPVPDYPYSDLDGNTTMAARAADLAAKKGILVFESAGNSGNDHWRMITTPADGDSVIAVGAVNAVDSVVGSFSSYGPSGDGQIKPDVASAGVLAVIQLGNNTVAQSNGTSYAAPKMAGLGTCLWQAFPEFSNIRIIRALRQASHRFDSPNDRWGYGIPDMKKAFMALLHDFTTTYFTPVRNGCAVSLYFKSKDIGGMKYIIERRGSAEQTFTKVHEIPAEPGNILTTHSYSFLNDLLVNEPVGTVDYRIIQVIDTAAASYTEVVIDQVAFGLSEPCILEDKIMVVPNPPTSHPAKLLVQTRFDLDMMHVHIYDMKGALVYQQSGPKSAGSTFIDLPSAKWAKGKYIIKVYNGNKELGTTSLLNL